MLKVLVGFKDVKYEAVVETPSKPLEIHIAETEPQALCGACKEPGFVHDRPRVKLCDLAGFHRKTQVVWRKHVFRCPNNSCGIKTWTSQDPRIAPAQHRVTTRAAKAMTEKVAATRTVKEVAREFGTSATTVDKYVHLYSEALFDDQHRQLRKTKAIGLDENSFVKLRGMRGKSFNTAVVDIESGKLIELLEGKDSSAIIRWFGNLPGSFRDAIEYVTLDMCNVYRRVARTVFPHATLVVDRFHVMKLANKNIDLIRAMLQRPDEPEKRRKDSPLYKARKLFRRSGDKLSDQQKTTLERALQLGDPTGMLTLAYLVKEATREIYTFAKAEADQRINDICAMVQKPSVPAPLRSFGKTLRDWKDEILAWHDCKLTNAKAEAANNSVKRIKRLGYGFKNFSHFRNRVLLCAGNPDMNLIRSLQL